MSFKPKKSLGQNFLQDVGLSRWITDQIDPSVVCIGSKNSLIAEKGSVIYDSSKGAVLMMIILGGLGSLRGAVLGTCAFILLKEALSSEAIFGALAGRWQLTLGLTMIAFVALMPKGLAGLHTQWQQRRKENQHGH